MIHATENNFGQSRGLMGSFQDGLWLARDGITVHNDPNEFGQDWQVQEDEDGLLFQTPSPYRESCDLPSQQAATQKMIRGRRLEESTISRSEALKGCAAHYSAPQDVEDCVFDVQVTGDLEMALSDELIEEV